MRLKTIFLSFSIIYLFIYLLNHSSKFVLLRCQSNTNRIRVLLKIFDRTKMACTQTFRLKIEESPDWMTYIDLFQLTLTTQYWKWESIWPSCILSTPYSLKNRTILCPCRILPKWFSCISQAISIIFKYLQHFQKEISPKTWVSCEVLYQAYNIFPFPIVKANWNTCITWLWIISIQSRNAIVTVHTCYFCKMIEMCDKIWSSQSSTMAF